MDCAKNRITIVVAWHAGRSSGKCRICRSAGDDGRPYPIRLPHRSVGKLLRRRHYQNAGMHGRRLCRGENEGKRAINTEREISDLSSAAR